MFGVFRMSEGFSRVNRVISGLARLLGCSKAIRVTDVIFGVGQGCKVHCRVTRVVFGFYSGS